MRLLLDTHVLLWVKADPGRLGDASRRAIVEPKNEVFVSLASAWELCVKAAAGKLLGNHAALIGSEDVFREQLDASGLELLPIGLSHVIETVRMPMHHRDPFDRLLIAQASIEDLTIVTADQAFRAYGARILPT